MSVLNHKYLDKDIWKKNNVDVPTYDIEHMRSITLKEPTWIHFGAGNIFRLYIAGLQDILLRKHITDHGIIVGETFDKEIIENIYKVNDQLTLSVIMRNDGTFPLKIIASVADSYSCDSQSTDGYNKFVDYFRQEKLQMVSLTVTEKGYCIKNSKGVSGSEVAIDMLKEHGLDDKNVSISDNALMMIIRNYTKEAGVRELERCISKIFRKIAKEIVVNDASIKKYKITEKNLIEYLGKKKFLYEELDKNDESGIANGLAYTEYGGVLLPIEVTYYKGKGALILTGSLGNVMKESAEIALSYIKSHYDEFGINYKLLTDSDIHIHVPEGAVPKDGPSAGITLTSALISAFTNKPIDKSIGMTGEITLRGTVLPIGGLKEKTMGAHRSGIKKILIPSKNECDLEEIPSEIKKDIKFVLVNNYEDVYKEIYKKEVK